MIKKPISEWTDEELRQELENLQAIKIPKREGRVPKPKRESRSTTNRKGSWQDEIFGE